MSPMSRSVSDLTMLSCTRRETTGVLATMAPMPPTKTRIITPASTYIYY
jgi:hypothetical protein